VQNAADQTKLVHLRACFVALVPLLRVCSQLMLFLYAAAPTMASLQEDPHDDYSHLLQDLSGGEGLQESTDLIWGSSDELGATHQAGSSSSDSALETESPMIIKVGRSLLLLLWLQQQTICMQ
jgi:hypothetical protein